MNKNFKLFIVTKDEEGSRLDRILRKRFPYLNQGTLEQAFRKKNILINQNKTSASYRAEHSDQLEIATILINEGFKKKSSEEKITQKELSLITNNIIYQDENLLAINKPAGLAVQGGSGIKVSVDEIMQKFTEKMETWSEDSKIHKLVHRLDKETSGILLIALNNKTANQLAAAFRNKLIQKKYLAVLAGKVEGNNSGKISSFIEKNSIVKDIKELNSKECNAFTNYNIINKNSSASFIEFSPITGKTHQLRLHSLELGFPILGDKKYGDNNDKNLHLHAYEIIIPYEGKNLKLRADLPSYFSKTLKDVFKISFSNKYSTLK